MLIFQTPQGEQAYFLEADAARSVAKMILQHAGGIVLPDGPLPPHQGG